MARFTPHLTAGAGVLVAFLLLGGAATEAVADPSHSNSDRDDSSDRGNGHGSRSDRGNAHGNGRGASDRGDGNRRGNDNSRKRGEDNRDGRAERGGVDSPDVQIGSVPIDLAEVAPSLETGKGGDGDGIADPGSERVDAAEVAELAPRIAADSGELRSIGSAATEFAESGVAAPPDRSGSDRADVPTALFSPPRLTLDIATSPGIQRRASEPRLQAPVPEAAPAAPPMSLLAPQLPAPASPQQWVKRLPAAPVLTQQLGVSGDADWSDPLWGLTGLLLIPAAGAILGYRQARAAHAAERLRRP